jgi:ribonuclease HI
MKKYYAVAEGRDTGIFQSWKETEPLVKGFPKAKFKSFKTLSEAQTYLSSTPTDTVINPLMSPAEETNINPDDNNTNTNTIIIYTDGSCVNSVGGYGFIVINNNNNELIPVSGKVPRHPCTNQIAELYAIYKSLSYAINIYTNDICRDGIVLWTDSKYSIGCLSNWHYNWSRNGWQTSKKEPVKNADIIKKILDLTVGIKIKYKHVKAHNGHKYNEWADRLANEGRTALM